MTALSDNLTNRSTTQPGTTLLIGLLRTNKASAYFLNSVSYSLSPCSPPVHCSLNLPPQGGKSGALNEQNPDSARGRAGSLELRLVCASDVDDGGCIFVPPWQRRFRHKQCEWRSGDRRCGPVCGPQR